MFNLLNRLIYAVFYIIKACLNWQKYFQVLVGATLCRFKSCHPHQIKKTSHLTGLFYLVFTVVCDNRRGGGILRLSPHLRWKRSMAFTRPLEYGFESECDFQAAKRSVDRPTFLLLDVIGDSYCSINCINTLQLIFVICKLTYLARYWWKLRG